MSRRGRITVVLVVLFFCLASSSLDAGDPVLPRRFTVVIDPGHGGIDPGAIGLGGIQEKEITLAIAHIIYIKAFEYPELRIILSRQRDEYVDPPDRALAANKIAADLYISIHANAYTSSSISGIETLIHETNGMESPSFEFAEMLQKKMVAKTGARDRGIKFAPLFIRRAQMPAVLAEVGFLTNHEEARLLRSLSYQSKIADAILEALLQFLHN